MGGLLALLVVGLLVFVSCGVPGGDDGDDGGAQEEPVAIGELDERAVAACEIYRPVAGDVRSGELTGPPLYRVLQDVYNEARQSQTEGFDVLVQGLLNAAIVGDEEARDVRLDQLEDVCEGAR